MTSTEKFAAGTPDQPEKVNAIEDSALEDAAGGASSSAIAAWRKTAEGEGRGAHIGCKDASIFIRIWRNADCPKCNASESLFGQSIRQIFFGVVDNHQYECADVKCYECGHLFGTCTLVAGQWEVYIQNWGR